MHGKVNDEQVEQLSVPSILCRPTQLLLPVASYIVSPLPLRLISKWKLVS